MLAISIFKMVSNIKALAAAILVSSLSACGTYQPKPLPEEVELVTDIATLRVDAESFPLPQLKGHAFDVSDGLDWIEVAMLAVASNPVLKASRTRRGVVAAQVYAAGLLPDPQLSVSLDHPTSGGPERVGGFVLGLGYDLQALITRNAGLDAGKETRRQVNLALLWQEWQVIQRARLLTVRVESAARKLALLEQAQVFYEHHYRQTRQLLDQGDLPLDAAAAVMIGWFETSSRLNRERQLYNRQLHELHALLGLAPEVRLSLAPFEAPPSTLLTVGDRIWSALPYRRPDLRALQAGYQSQEQRVRKAILAQFPALDIGFTRARDTDGVYTTGVGITLKLPLFSGNRGQIAIERATRQRLHTEYQARLDQTRSDISRLLDRQRILQRQRVSVQQHLPDLESLVMAARHAYRSGDLSSLDLLKLESTWLDKRLEMIDLERALWQVRIALDTLLAWPKPEV
ncbi:MAG: TolC family protein [Gammaproteobacteria bacterium]